VADNSWQGEFKVAVLPCNGIGRLSSTIVRLAAYRLAQSRPDQVILLSACALAVREEEEMAKLGRHPLLVLDACHPHCASKLAEELGKKPAGALYLGEMVAEEKISLAGEKRRALGKRGLEAAEAVAQKAAAAVDRIIAEEILSTM